MEQSADNIYLFDVESKRVLEANAALQNLLGYSAEEVKELTVYDFVNHTSEDIDQKIEMVLKKGSVFLKERKYRCKDGALLDVEISASSIIHKGKKTLCVVSRDITKRKIAEEALQESEKKYRQLAETAKDAIMMLDLKGNVKYINKEGLKLSGYSEDEALQMNVNDVLPADQLQSTYDKFEKRAAGESQIFMYEIEFINKEGKKIPVEVKSSLIEEQGKPSGVLIIARDITERKRADKELRKYSENQKVLIREINHRVRNNLTAIISMIYTEENLAEKKREFEFLPVLRNLAVRIQGLSTIHSLLSESEWRPLKIKQLCENVINATLKSMDSFKEINITIAPSEVRVESDQAHHLALVINELTTNSMKHTFENKEKGNISINIEEEGENILLDFSDDGPGYPQEMLKGDFSKTSTGFEIIREIVKRNLAGELKLNNDNGAVTTIIFKKVLE